MTVGGVRLLSETMRHERQFGQKKRFYRPSDVPVGGEIPSLDAVRIQ
jgi:hypothetical protein